MPMYVLQVMTGQETDITAALRRDGLQAYCPQETRMVRRGGQWHEELYTLFRSYVFVQTPDVLRCYYAVRGKTGVLRWLGIHSGAPVALAPDEEVRILWMAGGGPMPVSEAAQLADGTLQFFSGPLQTLAANILHIDRHDRRATVSLPVAGQEKQIKLSYKVIDAGCGAAAGTPRSEVPEDIV